MSLFPLNFAPLISPPILHQIAQISEHSQVFNDYISMVKRWEGPHPYMSLPRSETSQQAPTHQLLVLFVQYGLKTIKTDIYIYVILSEVE